MNYLFTFYSFSLFLIKYDLWWSKYAPCRLPGRSWDQLTAFLTPATKISVSRTISIKDKNIFRQNQIEPHNIALNLSNRYLKKTPKLWRKLDFPKKSTNIKKDNIPKHPSIWKKNNILNKRPFWMKNSRCFIVKYMLYFLNPFLLLFFLQISYWFLLTDPKLQLIVRTSEQSRLIIQSVTLSDSVWQLNTSVG